MEPLARLHTFYLQKENPLQMKNPRKKWFGMLMSPFYDFNIISSCLIFFDFLMLPLIIYSLLYVCFSRLLSLSLSPPLSLAYLFCGIVWFYHFIGVLYEYGGVSGVGGYRHCYRFVDVSMLCRRVARDRRAMPLGDFLGVCLRGSEPAGLAGRLWPGRIRLLKGNLIRRPRTSEPTTRVARKITVNKIERRENHGGTSTMGHHHLESDTRGFLIEKVGV